MVSSVAVAEEKKLLAELTVQTRLTHSETLLPHIEEVLKMAGVAKSDLTAVAVSNGPGSFTGLRIGLATAKAICYGLNIPIVGVPTTEALAWHYPVEEIRVMPFIDAQKGNVYTALYQWQAGEPKELAPVAVHTLDEALGLAAAQPATVAAVGDMVMKKLAQRENLPANLLIPPAHMVMPRAATVAMAGLNRLSKNQLDNVMNLEPVYIRRSEAEVLWEKRQAKLQAEQGAKTEQVQP